LFKRCQRILQPILPHFSSGQQIPSHLSPWVSDYASGPRHPSIG
jgi:hypothetical protein